MRFGKTLRDSIYQPWKDQYLDYAKLKSMLREDEDSEEVTWSEDDENRFCAELFNVQLDKVVEFHKKIIATLQDRADSAFDKLRDIAPPPADDGQPQDGEASTSAAVPPSPERLKSLRSDLDAIADELQHLKRYCGTNYTGFFKIAKKHDRKRGDRYKVRPMMRVSLSQNGFNSEAPYQPLLNKLSMTYWIINQHLEDGEVQPLNLEQEEVRHGERYTAHKFWVHPDNLLEVKTAILRHLPALHFQQQSAKELDGNEDLATTSLYFDSKHFELYERKVDRQADATSLRLRWHGPLASKPDIILEQKIIHENGSSEEKRFTIKDKYVRQFIDGNYQMEKTVQKMERQGQKPEEIEKFRNNVQEIQAFMKDKKLEPLLRANYTRTAFQKPQDDRVRILIDTDIAFIREDTLDPDRPCRDPKEWHRRDIDGSNMTYPFTNMNQSEVSKFPHALLEIKLKEDGARKRPAWIEDLMASHLVYTAPKFSKFVHGIASLFEDYVNTLPFWLSDLETDIRKDPQTAHDQEEQRKARRAEDAQVVGSFLGANSKGGSYKPAGTSPIAKSYLSERAAAEAARGGSQPPEQPAGEQDDEPEEENQGYVSFSHIFPGFSLSKYSLSKKQQLPEGVTKPKTWIKNAGPVQVEPKVWLANERTFLKWQHICVLLGSLAVGLYTAAGENMLAEIIGIAYIGIAVLAGLWGYTMLHVRRNMILERSGKDFDNMIGPLAVSVAMMLVLILNFVFAYQKAFAKLDDNDELLGAGIEL